MIGLGKHFNFTAAATCNQKIIISFFTQLRDTWKIKVSPNIIGGNSFTHVTIADNTETKNSQKYGSKNTKSNCKRQISKMAMGTRHLKSE